jgi:hypothetical protein
MADPTFWEDQFEKKANLPLTWRVRADDLLVAAEMLYAPFSSWVIRNLKGSKTIPNEARLLSAVLLLRAAATEALLKGRAVRRGHRFVVKGNFP